MAESLVTKLDSALHQILRNALAVDGVCKGIRECAKALDKRTAIICIVAENCDEKAYIVLVEALCRENNIPLLKYPDNKRLGELAGLCKIDGHGEARKIVSSSCVVIKDIGESSEGWDYITQLLNLPVANA